jgi:predicted alpha/beta-hydrolase family hydrolase
MEARMPSADTWQIDAGGGETVTAVYEPASAGGDAPRVLFVCAHGAGGNMSDKAMLAVTARLRAVGLDLVRFNFAYSEHKRNRPDPMPQLQACVAAVADHARHVLRPERLIVGGRSMGGRAASMLAAGGYACDGVLLLAYPLHPAGQPEKLRDAHLAAIPVPVLCFNGTRDTLCEQDLMQATLQRHQIGTDRWTMHWLEGADHSFHVLKSSGRTDRDVLDETADATVNWLATKLAHPA